MVPRRNFIIGSGVVVLGSTLLTNSATGLAKAAPPSPAWLSESVLYLLYPQSFADSNGDGMGDISGKIEHLDYLSWLGVNLIWTPRSIPLRSPTPRARRRTVPQCWKSWITDRAA